MKPMCLMLSTLGLAFATMEVDAQTWPTKPLRAIVPVAAGSTTDIVPRLVFEQLSRQFGQSIIVGTAPAQGGRPVPPSSLRRTPMATPSSPTEERTRSRRHFIRS